jgi:hypothetical protein
VKEGVGFFIWFYENEPSFFLGLVSVSLGLLRTRPGCAEDVLYFAGEVVEK